MKYIYIFWGKVKKGKNRGKDLGFPTANVAIHKNIPEGIYASKVQIQNKEYIAATFVGSAKTFNEKDYKAEMHILDFSQNIYNKWVGVKLYKRIRENKKFNLENDLKKQMENDVKQVIDFFKNSQK